MSNIPTDLRYAESHEWVRLDAEGVATVGISDPAQDALGDLVYVELPEVGDSLEKGDEAGVVESVKAASDIYAPVAGEVVEVNESLDDAPEQVNNDAYHDGWLFKLKVSDPEEVKTLLDAEQYGAQQS